MTAALRSSLTDLFHGNLHARTVNHSGHNGVDVTIDSGLDLTDLLVVNKLEANFLVLIESLRDHSIEGVSYHLSVYFLTN